MEKFLSQSEFAKHRNLTRARISQLMPTLRKAGAVTASGRVDVAKADAYLAANLNQAKSRKVKRSLPTEAEARTRNLEVRTAKTELELKFRRGQLVDVAEVEEAAFNAGRQTRDSVLSVPEKIGDELALISNPFELKARLTRELRQALTNASTWGEQPEE
jgi:hypothetical protein